MTPGVVVSIPRDDDDGLWPAGLIYVERCEFCRRWGCHDAAAAAAVRALDGFRMNRVYETPTDWRWHIASRGSPNDRDVHLYRRNPT